MYYPIWYDSTFLIFIVPALVLGLIAQAAVRGRFNKYSKVHTLRGLTGAQAAREILDSNGLYDVSIEEARGFLGDHYDPRSRTLRLSSQVGRSPSVAAVGVAAHEAGHALQHASRYWPLQFRSALVPAVQFGSWLGPLAIMAGIFMEILMGSAGAALGNALAWFGVALFALVVAFAFVTLPVELNASARAKTLLYQYNIVDRRELNGVNAVLNAAAWTYVVAAVSALLQLVRWIFILTASRRD